MTKQSAFIRLHARDDVLIACQQLVGGTSIENITVRGLIPGGHKVAIRNLQTGEPIRRYNQIIGFASKSIQAGDHVHVHNCSLGDDKGSFERDYAFCTEVPTAPAKKQATFMGYRRNNGQVATRNYIGILSSVNCSATVARGLADFFWRGRPHTRHRLRDGSQRTWHAITAPNAQWVCKTCKFCWRARRRTWL